MLLSGLKRCQKCGEEKPADDFYKSKAHKGGTVHQCKACKKLYRRQHYLNCDRTRKKRLANEWTRRNIKKHMVNQSRAASKRRGIEHNITENDFDVPLSCPLLGIKLCVEHRGTQFDDSPSLDRIDSSKGYVKGNVAVISQRANRIKNNATAEELKLIAERIDGYLYDSRPVETQDTDR